MTTQTSTLTQAPKDELHERRLRAMEAATSLLQSRAKLAQAFGQGFGGRRDYYKTFGYPDTITQQQLWHTFSRQNIARRIVVAPVAATWVRPPNVVFKNARAQTRWDKLVSDKKLNIWFQLARLDVLCGLGDFAILFISMEIEIHRNQQGE